MTSNTKTSNGLPLDVKYCIKCNLSNQRTTGKNEYFHTEKTIHETVKFDDDGICAGCKFVEKEFDETINWNERERELKDLCDKFRKNNGEFDCLVPGSGGKDSVYASHVLKYKYKMNPLTVTWSPNLYTEIGWKNFQSWLHKGGFSNFLYTPNPKIHKLITREATKRLLHPFQTFIIGQKTFALKIAAKLNIPLIFYGEGQGKGGKNISHTAKSFSESKTQAGFEMDPLEGKDFKKLFLVENKLRNT